MARILLALIALLATSFLANAQVPTTVPFDMGNDGTGPKQPPASQPRQPSAPSQPAEETLPFFRYIIPADEMRIEGENVDRSWSVYLTEEQANSPARLNVAFQNSIFIAPEFSNFTISINNVKVAVPELSASERPADLRYQVPEGVLKPGYNLVSFDFEQRHRTDCGLESIYDLWTDIDQERTFLLFSDPNAAMLSRLDDLRAVGVDDEGRTRFHIVAPALNQQITADPLLELSQGLALLADMPNTMFTYSKSAPAKFASGVLPVYVGTPA